MDARIRKSISDSIEVKKQLLNDADAVSALSKAVGAIVDTYKRDDAVYAIGNGGSAADVQHFVSELVGRCCYDRAPLRAFALTANSSNLTLIGNDYGYDELFARQVWASGRKGDLLVAVSTSGNSKNIILAAQQAHKLGMFVVGLTGARGGQLAEIADVTLRAPSNETARIQECHGLFCHILCEHAEAELFPRVGKSGASPSGHQA